MDVLTHNGCETFDAMPAVHTIFQFYREMCIGDVGEKKQYVNMVEHC